ncbi:putative aspartyl protease [Chryseobacterium sp. SORGH_AS 447]|uniref:retropepsin-like aspartic protease n=1 Tax=Chryseobacterium sp. SORGH_AS_0447 TaxID=3041769 RepID=UPI002786810A|nr:aspartyl protease family protein [Chryseobacterium sp. SORGH_AS_0447]MDQ1162313.1 putative aspartyl protease [Chryseobacterium sp. SORGH_AS_0447]
MKKVLYSLFVFSMIHVSSQTKKFFLKGEVQLQHPVEKINLRFENNLPFVQVNISGKFYNFLFDSGAPTVISTAIYNELKLKKKYKRSVGDSNNNKQQQVFTELPEMTVDQVVFKNIGAIVLDLNSAELGCLKVDGIIGANQMAKLFWRINYGENSLETTRELSYFNLKDYPIILPFDPKPQKTPVVTTPVFGKNIEVTFDTGFSGRFEIMEKNFDPSKVTHKIETFGTRSTGAFGAAKPVAGTIFRIDSLALGNKIFHNEMISTGTSDLMGNEFLRDFSFILDWKNNKIYLKSVRNTPPKLESFGFTYRFVDQKPVVAFIFQHDNFPLKIGDSIISINNVRLDHLDGETACHYFINRVERDQQTIAVKVKRDGKVMEFTLDRKAYLN